MSGDVDEFVTVAQAAALLQISVRTVRRMIRDGRLRASRLRGTSIIRLASSNVVAVLEPVNGEGRAPMTRPRSVEAAPENRLRVTAGGR